MATQLATPPNPNDEKPQNPGAESVQPPLGDQQNTGVDPSKISSPTSVFVNSEPIREEQVQNAVKFLSHPKVRGSPVMYRRSFLEKKGLTKEEIDEAFRRVPDPSPTVETSGVSQDNLVKQSSNIQHATPMQTMQPVSAAPAGIVTAPGALARYRFHWSHAILAIGFFAASGAGTVILMKKSIIPRLKLWIRKVITEEPEPEPGKEGLLKPSLAEETAAAAKSAAAAAADVAKVSQDILNSKLEERRHFQDFVKLLDVQVQEMKSMTNAIRRLEGQTHISGRTSVSEHEDYRVNAAITKQSIVNGKADYDSRPVRSSASPPTSVEPSTAPHPKSYTEIMAMIQRGEKPSNIREINDAPPNPNQKPSNPRLAPRAKPWESGQSESNSGQVVQSQVNGLNDPNSNSKFLDNSYQLNDDHPVPWWERKNVRITEIENENEANASPYVAQANDQPARRAWVPPQPPPVVMPEAAEAIRRPKVRVQTEQSTEDQSAVHTSDVSEDSQKVTDISDSGDAIESNGGNSMRYAEIQEQDEV